MNERDIISNKRNKKNYQQQVMYNQTFCTFAALNQSGILLDYYLVYFCVIIYIPPDKTRKPEWYDGIYNYLKAIGLKEI